MRNHKHTQKANAMLDRAGYARGGGVKHKPGHVTVNVISPQAQQPPQRVPVPVPVGGPPPGAMPPHPPMAGPPPGAGPGMPPGMPPGIMPGRPGGMKRGGGVYPIDDGAGGGAGRMEKADAYGGKPRRAGGKAA